MDQPPSFPKRCRRTTPVEEGIYQSLIGCNPYVYLGLAVEKRKALRNVIKEFIGLEDSGLWGKKYFPDPEKGGDALKALCEEFYGETVGPDLNGGWTNIAVHNGAPKVLEDNIVRGLIPILKRMISHAGLSGTRAVVDCRNHPIKGLDGGTLKPDLFLWGKGSGAFSDVQGVPPVNLESKSKKGKTSFKYTPPIDWHWCIMPIEVKVDKRRGGRKNMASIIQLGTYVREVFAAQRHRLWVPSLLFTECTVEFLIWTRESVRRSTRLDYHAHPKRFCHIFSSILSWDDEAAGFDPSITCVDGQLQIVAENASLTRSTHKSGFHILSRQ